MANYAEAPEVEQIAGQVIKEHHPHLQTATMRYLMSDTTKSKVVLCDPERRYWTSGSEEDVEQGADWLIMVETDEWEGLTERQRVCLVDELLTACGQAKNEKTGAVRWTKKQGVTVFPEVLRRRGFWRAEYASIEEVAKQPELPGIALAVAAQ